MNLLILGRGKTGALVGDVARSRRHHVQVLFAAENAGASALTPDSLASTDVVIDFTTPAAVVANVEACIRAKKNLVVGTTGWYDQVPRLREMVLSAETGFLYGSNFSIGVNLFFEIAATAGVALKYYYSGQIFLRMMTLQQLTRVILFRRDGRGCAEIRLLGSDFRASSCAKKRRS